MIAHRLAGRCIALLCAVYFALTYGKPAEKLLMLEVSRRQTTPAHAPLWPDSASARTRDTVIKNKGLTAGLLIKSKDSIESSAGNTWWS